MEYVYISLKVYDIWMKSYFTFCIPSQYHSHYYSLSLDNILGLEWRKWLIFNISNFDTLTFYE